LGNFGAYSKSQNRFFSSRRRPLSKTYSRAMYFPAATSPAETPAASSSRKILVIDDSALIREAAKIALGAIGGWQISTAASGEEGIELAISGRFDAVLLDVVMPGMDGIVVAERLHAIAATRLLPIIFLTAYDRLERGERLRSTQVDGVIAKPFDISDLARQVATLLRWPA
jgi:two-component system, OmpR family, alkaline phosphatase synthesis response regulator PhoP